MSVGPHTLAGLIPDWAEELHAAPREHFIPDQAWSSPLEGEDTWIDRDADPQAWRAAVYADTTITTQVDDGDTPLTADTAPQRLPTSSSTAPTLAARFLRLLDPYPGDRVMEIGTGTGWSAALLAARLGEDNVTTIEVDEHIAAQAKANLDAAGFAPHLIVGDGAIGYPNGAPYDRVHATCAVRRIPYPWVGHTRPGGIIALPWSPNYGLGYALRLTSTGRTAFGRLHGDAGFMMLRSQRHTYPHPDGERRYGEPRVDPRRITRAGRGMELAAAALLPGVVFNGSGLDGSDVAGVRHPASASYATARHTPDGAEVAEVGPRNLWGELEDAYLAWLSWGQPGPDRFGVTVDTGGQHLWLDTPRHLITGGPDER